MLIAIDQVDGPRRCGRDIITIDLGDAGKIRGKLLKLEDSSTLGDNKMTVTVEGVPFPIALHFGAVVDIEEAKPGSQNNPLRLMWDKYNRTYMNNWVIFVDHLGYETTGKLVEYELRHKRVLLQGLYKIIEYQKYTFGDGNTRTIQRYL